MKNDTSWESADRWYDQIVGKKGHYYHQNVILPSLLSLLELTKFQNPTLLDLACGQGVLARQLPPSVTYHGIDASPSLIKSAHLQKTKSQFFEVADICKPLPFEENRFTHATIVLALQNIEDPASMIKETFRCLSQGGIFVLVLNHPCFRIPRQTHWEVDPSKKLQYRRIDAYLTPLKIPIQVHPGQEKGATVWAFHYPLSLISKFLSDAGFYIQTMEEWISDKQSTGSAAKMENRSRKEFPLFLAIKAIKK